MTAAGSPLLQVFRGEFVHFLADPAAHGNRAWEHLEDGILVLRDGHIAELAPASVLLPALPPELPVTDYRGKLIVPGFIDTHTHYPQTDIIASPGEQLLSWLEKYTFPAEAAFADAEHAAAVAAFFCDQLLRHGSTTAMVFATIHPVSVDAFFDAARQRRMRVIAGKVLMDRNCPPGLCDTVADAAADSRRLIERWHRQDRLRYAITPRFAPTSTPAQLNLAHQLLAEHEDLHLQTHLAENRAEVAWMSELYPQARSYLDVYEQFGLLGARSVFAHCIWIDDTDRQRLAARGSAISFCPASNLFLGSGLFDLERARAHGIRLGIGTDIGAGSSFSILHGLAEAYKVLQLQGQYLAPAEAFYLATLGGAKSLRLEHCIGNFLPGKEADFVVLDPQASTLLARRMASCHSLQERLFAFMLLADERAIHATHVLGEAVWSSAPSEIAPATVADHLRNSP